MILKCINDCQCGKLSFIKDEIYIFNIIDGQLVRTIEGKMYEVKLSILEGNFKNIL